MPRDPRIRHSAIMTGWVRHRRHRPAPHAFRFPICMLYLDLDEIDAVFGGRWLWSARRAALIRFRRSDYLVNDDPQQSLGEAVRSRVRVQTGRRIDGPVRLLTIPRAVGVSFSPVSFYYCFESDGRTLGAVVAEITNTPWLERHAYVLDVGDAPERREQRSQRWSFDKGFHVSPFMPMDQRYVWHFAQPPRVDDGKLAVVMHNHDAEGQRVFDATLSLRRRPIRLGNRLRMMLGYPAMNLQALAAIYAHAGLLRLKGAPFYPHPGRPSRPAMENQS